MQRGRLTKAITGTVAAVVLTALGGCGLFDDGEDDMTRAAVLGDSVVEQATGPIEAALDAGARDAEAHGYPGYTTAQLLPHGAELFGGTARPGVGLVMTGHNDLWRSEIIDDDLDAMVDLLAGLDCGILVLVPTKGPWDPASARDLNAALVAAAEHQDVHVETAWRDAVDDTDDDEPSPRLIDPDTVHSTPEGKNELASIMAAAVDRYCG